MSAKQLRMIVFVVIAALMVAGPTYRQVFGGKNKVFRSWTMFSSIGSGEVDARFYQLLDSGETILLDHREILGGGAQSFRDMPRNTWRIRDRHGGAEEVLRRLCGELGQTARIKILARVATRRGWKTELDGEEFSCLEFVAREGGNGG